MVNENNNQKMKRVPVLLGLVLAISIPFTSLAETSPQALATTADTTTSATVHVQSLSRGSSGRMIGDYNVDTSSLTDEQKTAYESALALYEQVEDAVLSDLMAASIVAQADVDAYTALRAAQKSLSDLDQAAWSAEQYKAFYEANTKTGDKRKAAMQALADAGQLTQAQADALSAQGQSDLWTKVAQNASTNSIIKTAISTMQQARQKFTSSLRDAGITGVGKGGMFGSFGIDANPNGQGFNKNDNSNRMQGGKGARK